MCQNWEPLVNNSFPRCKHIWVVFKLVTFPTWICHFGPQPGLGRTRLSRERGTPSASPATSVSSAASLGVLSRMLDAKQGSQEQAL